MNDKEVENHSLEGEVVPSITRQVVVVVAGEEDQELNTSGTCGVDDENKSELEEVDHHHNKRNDLHISTDETVELFRSEDLESYEPIKPSLLLAFQKNDESEDDDHHILSPVVRKHIKDNHITPIGLKKNKRMFLELFHQTMPKMIATTEDPEEKQCLAATLLQKVVRGWIVRKRYTKRRIENAKLSAEFADEQSLIEGWKLKKKKLTKNEMNEQCKILEHAVGSSITRIKNREKVMNESAVIIQKAWRHYYCAKRDQIRLKPIPPNESVQLIHRISNSKYFKNRESLEDIMESLASKEIYGLPLLSESTFERNPKIAYSFKITIF